MCVRFETPYPLDGPSNIAGGHSALKGLIKRYLALEDEFSIVVLLQMKS